MRKSCENCGSLSKYLHQSRDGWLKCCRERSGCFRHGNASIHAGHKDKWEPIGRWRADRWLRDEWTYGLVKYSIAPLGGNALPILNRTIKTLSGLRFVDVTEEA